MTNPAAMLIRAPAYPNGDQTVLDPAIWELRPDGNPMAVFPHRIEAASMGEEGVLLIEYAETPDEVRTGPYKKIQIYVNTPLAEHFHKLIDAAVTK
jgi:hypothetical protein